MSKNKKEKKSKKEKKAKKVQEVVKPVETKTRTRVKKEKVLTDEITEELRLIIDIDSVSDDYDQEIIEKFKKSKYDKDLIIEFLVLYARDAER